MIHSSAGKGHGAAEDAAYVLFGYRRCYNMINNLEAYKVFYYVAKCGSVTKAAGELSISQPAVSQAVKQLENTLDVSLFHRAAKGVRLTGDRKSVGRERV